MSPANDVKMADLILAFLHSLPVTPQLPATIDLLNPYLDDGVVAVTKAFYSTYYADTGERIFVLGINPGRHGSGLTGISFTDPIQLTGLRVDHNFELKAELSSRFMYELIDQFGGASKFYSTFYLGSVCPLGFTRNGKNLNYYDDNELQKLITDYIINSIHRQLAFGLSRDIAFCLGEGRNFQFLSRLNETEQFFKTIIPLPHPRFIMQYKLKAKQEYLNSICQKLIIASCSLTSH